MSLKLLFASLCFTDMFKDDEEDEEHQDDADELLSLIYSKSNK